MINKDAIWFVTGSSKGLGKAIAEQALEAGYRVAATARRREDLDELAARYPEAMLPVVLDVSKPEQIGPAVQAAERRFGAVDVLVNNAGYGYFSAIEEGDDAGVRAMFETNVFAPVNLVKAVLPGMRQRKRGYIVNISSVGGMVTFPAIGYYHMAKFALEGMSETLAKEVAPFGIGVTVVEPGAFRTDFRGAATEKQSPTRIADYAETAGKARDGVMAKHGQQQGDPVRGARAILTAVESERPPLHLVIGADAVDLIRQKLADLKRDLDGWEELSRSTDIQEAVHA